ncbi:gamma-glutamylaminecyclotransferase C-like [Dermacentor andersoni]|uniref:gamma-glutamylaminecyclotransferase C-like n=1 Tax=Dermacentor andersoni TaxID=34620 RepID=UPI003B3B9093
MAAEIGGDKAMHPVFTYGTLKCGQPNHHILMNPNNGRATLIGTARTLKKWPLVLVSSYEIPCLLPREGMGHRFIQEVSGEMYLVDDQMLESLDGLESHPDVYVRTQQDVALLSSRLNSSVPDAEAKLHSGGLSSTEGGEIRKAWIYFARKVEDEHLSLPFVSRYNCKQDIEYPTSTADKQESLRFLNKHFKHTAVDESHYRAKA